MLYLPSLFIASHAYILIASHATRLLEVKADIEKGKKQHSHYYSIYPHFFQTLISPSIFSFLNGGSWSLSISRSQSLIFLKSAANFKIKNFNKLKLLK